MSTMFLVSVCHTSNLKMIPSLEPSIIYYNVFRLTTMDHDVGIIEPMSSFFPTKDVNYVWPYTSTWNGYGGEIS